MFCLCLPECRECEDGYFSKSINSPCQKWKEYVRPPLMILEKALRGVLTSMLPFFPCRCKFGVNITGSKTSDVTCNDAKHTDSNASHTPGRAVPTDQPRGRVHIQKLLTATTMTTPRRIPLPETSSPSNTADPIGKTLPPSSAHR